MLWLYIKRLLKQYEYLIQPLGRAQPFSVGIQTAPQAVQPLHFVEQHIQLDRLLATNPRVVLLAGKHFFLSKMLTV